MCSTQADIGTHYLSALIFSWKNTFPPNWLIQEEIGPLRLLLKYFEEDYLTLLGITHFRFKSVLGLYSK
jgi:hypothetical protein